MGRVASLGLVGIAFALLTMATVDCGGQASKQSGGGDTTAGIDTSEVEKVARALVELGGTFDYRDQKSQYEQLQPLLADKTSFQEDPNAVSSQRIETSRATATRVDAISDNDAIVTVTADHFRSFLPSKSSEVVKEHLLQQIDCRLVREEGRWLVSRSMILSEQSLPQDERPTPIVATPSDTVPTVPAANEDEIRNTIRGLVLAEVDPRIQDVQVGGQTYYTDPSGTEWIGFTAFPIPAEATDPAFGVMKKPSGEGWQLLFAGTGPIGDALPDDVKSGLGIDW
jgi:hypothetical protein